MIIGPKLDRVNRPSRQLLQKNILFITLCFDVLSYLTEYLMELLDGVIRVVSVNFVLSAHLLFLYSLRVHSIRTSFILNLSNLL